MFMNQRSVPRAIIDRDPTVLRCADAEAILSPDGET